MKKKNLSLTIFTALLLPVFALAVSAPLDVVSILGRVANLLWSVFFGLSILAFIYAGILFVWSGSNPSKAGDAKKVVIYAIIGMCVVMLGYSVQKIVKEILGVL